MRRATFGPTGRVPRRLWPLLVILGACSSTSATNTVDQAPTASPHVWVDQFDGPQGAAPDPSVWSAELGGTGWGNQQLQDDIASAATLDGHGDLVVTARPATESVSCWYGTCRFVAGRLTTFGKFAQRYGHFEVRLRLPGGTATWPAVWMLGVDRYAVGWPKSGELDIAESVGRDDGVVSGAAHGPGFSGDAAISGDVRVDPALFHVYTLDWTADQITWRVDGVVFHHLAKRDTPDWVFDKPFFLVIDLAVGGPHAGKPGPGDDQPQQLVVDYVRVSTTATP
jgi:beta-glucanase (GH16 family)